MPFLIIGLPDRQQYQQMESGSGCFTPRRAARSTCPSGDQHIRSVVDNDVHPIQVETPVSATPVVPVAPAQPTPVKAATPPEPVEAEFEFSDTNAKTCLLCARQFKSLDQLKRHNKESDLHKVSCLPCGLFFALSHVTLCIVAPEKLQGYGSARGCAREGAIRPCEGRRPAAQISRSRF